MLCFRQGYYGRASHWNQNSHFLSHCPKDEFRDTLKVPDEQHSNEPGLCLKDYKDLAGEQCVVLFCPTPNMERHSLGCAAAISRKAEACQSTVAHTCNPNTFGRLRWVDRLKPRSSRPAWAWWNPSPVIQSSQELLLILHTYWTGTRSRGRRRLPWVQLELRLQWEQGLYYGWAKEGSPVSKQQNKKTEDKRLMEFLGLKAKKGMLKRNSHSFWEL